MAHCMRAINLKRSLCFGSGSLSLAKMGPRFTPMALSTPRSVNRSPTSRLGSRNLSSYTLASASAGNSAGASLAEVPSLSWRASNGSQSSRREDSPRKISTRIAFVRTESSSAARLRISMHCACSSRRRDHIKPANGPSSVDCAAIIWEGSSVGSAARNSITFAEWSKRSGIPAGTTLPKCRRFTGSWYDRRNWNATLRISRRRSSSKSGRIRTCLSIGC